jgi:hypothetical protein
MRIPRRSTRSVCGLEAIYGSWSGGPLRVRELGGVLLGAAGRDDAAAWRGATLIVQVAAGVWG